MNDPQGRTVQLLGLNMNEKEVTVTILHNKVNEKEWGGVLFPGTLPHPPGIIWGLIHHHISKSSALKRWAEVSTLEGGEERAVFPPLQSVLSLL